MFGEAGGNEVVMVAWMMIRMLGVAMHAFRIRNLLAEVKVTVHISPNTLCNLKNSDNLESPTHCKIVVWGLKFQAASNLEPEIW